MSHVEFYDKLAQIALGWLGWTEEQALKADVNAILIAQEGRIDMFCAVGWMKKKEPEAPLPVLTPKVFSSVFSSKRH